MFFKINDKKISKSLRSLGEKVLLVSKETIAIFRPK
jgi:hypothetical protein